MKRPFIFILLALVLVAASGTLIFRLRPETSQSATDPKATAKAGPFRRKVDAAMATRQPSSASTAMKQKNQVSATETAQLESRSRRAADSQMTAAPAANAAIPELSHADRPSQITPKSAPVADESSLPAIQLADDVRLPAALMPHDTSKESPEIAAARAAIGDRFYQELQETAAKEPPSEADTTTVIHKSSATENALKRANEEYRALFGDEAFNRKTMDTHLEVKLPTLEDTPPESSH